MNDYKWIIDDINNSIILSLFYKNDTFFGSFEAVSLVDELGNNINSVGDNINDLLNLINSSMVRFKMIKIIMDEEDDIYLDIPLRNIGFLYNSCDIVIPRYDKVVVNNNIIPISQIDAFSIVDGFLLTDNYGIKGLKYDTVSVELDKLIKIVRDFPTLGMEERYYALHELYNLNLKRMNKDNSSDSFKKK